MKFKQILSGIVALSVLSGCSVFPIQTSVEAGHSRLENFILDDGTRLEQIRLMCYRNKLNDRSSARQLEAGDHALWVKARIETRGLPNRTLEGYAQLNAKLHEGKEYTLNRKVEDDSITLWIQELDSNQRVSEVASIELQQPVFNNAAWQRSQCKSSTV
ncbi:MAG: hypothetical protein ACFHVJ_04065 [Aestuariibacter sp.]